MKLKHLFALTLCLFVGTFALVANEDKTQPESKYADCDTCDDDSCPSDDENSPSDDKPEKDDR